MSQLRLDSDGLTRSIGMALGTSTWHEITQPQVDRFADATGDHNWLHVDPDRAEKSTFGGTIAHGFLTLALVTPLLAEIVQISDVALKLNYGLDRVRFIDKVPVGGRVRLSASVRSVEPCHDGAKIVFALEMHRDGGSRPVMAAQMIIRTYVDPN